MPKPTSRDISASKKRASRIDLDYFKKPHWFRSWASRLTGAAAALSLIFSFVLFQADTQEFYSAGPLSPAHSVIAHRCELCHVGESGAIRRRAKDEACLACHDGPSHNPGQEFTPQCADCHIEHRGRQTLVSFEDWACTRCHKDLVVRHKALEFERSVRNFSTHHPEFAVLRAPQGDAGTIKLNHEVHLKSDLCPQEDKPEWCDPLGPTRLECSDCHRPPSVAGRWDYGEDRVRVETPAEPDDVLAPRPTSAYMGAIEYDKHCMRCHPLLFDRRFREPVPHEEPEVVIRFVRKKFSDYIARHPAERREEPPLRPLPRNPVPAQPRLLSAARWVALRMEETEKLLWQKTCKECHTLSFPSNAPPKVAQASLTARWFQHAIFSHESHRMLLCTSCHTAVETSRETADVLLPGIQTCRRCHHPEGGAEARCYQCHQYHDWKKRKRVEPRFTISDVLQGDGTSARESEEDQMAPAK